MVTREEYNNALDVIEEYHKQIFLYAHDEKLRNLSKTEWTKWSKLNTDCSTRLRNIITFNPDFYLETMTFNQFTKLRNAGIGSWEEFTTLRGY